MDPGENDQDGSQTADGAQLRFVGVKRDANAVFQFVIEQGIGVGCGGVEDDETCASFMAGGGAGAGVCARLEADRDSACGDGSFCNGLRLADDVHVGTCGIGPDADNQ